MRKHKAKATLMVCIMCFLISIPCFSHSGQYIVDLMDTYGGGLSVMFVAIFETMVLMWIYGVGRFSSDLKFMLETKGKKINRFFGL